jgi:hypothetical protein
MLRQCEKSSLQKQQCLPIFRVRISRLSFQAVGCYCEMAAGNFDRSVLIFLVSSMFSHFLSSILNLRVLKLCTTSMLCLKLNCTTVVYIAKSDPDFFSSFLQAAKWHLKHLPVRKCQYAGAWMQNYHALACGAMVMLEPSHTQLTDQWRMSRGRR